VGGQVRIERDGALGWLIFDHPERRNAISVEMWRKIPSLAQELADDDAVRVVILRGAGEQAFVSGADISEFAEHRTGDATRGYDIDSAHAFAALANLPMPVIAMIHGACVGGGAALAITADLRFAAENAFFAIPAARLGLGYHMSGIEALARIVGLSAAKEIFFTARRFQADEALHMGLVNGVVAPGDLERHVRETAERIAANAPLTVRSVKRIASELARPAASRDVDAVEASIRACFESDDYAEGIRAFLEKRKPRFQGR
jgi:enoyl-CoA hydratase/carnithine racemase